MNVKKIKKEINLHSDFKVYLFGSFLNNDNYNDIDLLILYNSQLFLISEILLFRTLLVNFFKEHFNIILDISLLSYLENKQIDFLSKLEHFIKIEQE